MPPIAALAGFGWASFGILIAARAKSIESFSYWQSGLLTPMFLVAGTFFPLDDLPTWAQVLGHVNPLFHWESSSATRCSASRSWEVFWAIFALPGRLRARVVAARDPLHGAPADPVRSVQLTRQVR